MPPGPTARGATAAAALSVLLVACGSPATSPGPKVMVDYPFYESAEALTEAADLVVVGTPVDSREDTLLPSLEGDDPQENPRAGMEQDLTDEELQAAAVPITVSTVRIDEVVVGTAEAGGVIEVSQVTGEAGSPIKDGPVLLFLAGEGGQFHIVGGSQGQWLQEDGAFRAVATDRTELMLPGADVAGLGYEANESSRHTPRHAAAPRPRDRSLASSPGASRPQRGVLLLGWVNPQRL